MPTSRCGYASVLDSKKSVRRSGPPSMQAIAVRSPYLHETIALGAARRGRLSGRLRGVPSTFIACSDHDPLRDEALQYASRLLRAGVAAELHVFPGTCDGFDSLFARMGNHTAAVRPSGAGIVPRVMARHLTDRLGRWSSGLGTSGSIGVSSRR